MVLISLIYMVFYIKLIFLMLYLFEFHYCARVHLIIIYVTEVRIILVKYLV